MLSPVPRRRPNSRTSLLYACGWSPQRRLSRVVLPDPLGPTTAHRSPAHTVQLTSRRIAFPPCETDTPRSSSIGGPNPPSPFTLREGGGSTEPPAPPSLRGKGDGG